MTSPSRPAPSLRHDVRPGQHSRNAPHTALCKMVLEYIYLRGGWGFHVHGHLGQQPGIPDLLGCLKGRLIGVEVKTGKGRLGAKQWRQKEAIEAAGGLWVLVHELEDLEDALLDAGLIDTPAVWPRRAK